MMGVKSQVNNNKVFDSIVSIVKEVFSNYFRNFEKYRPVLLERIDVDKIYQTNLKELSSKLEKFINSFEQDCRICRENISKIARIAFVDIKGNVYYPIEEVLSQIEKLKDTNDKLFYSNVFRDVLKEQKEKQIVSLPSVEVLNTVECNKGLKNIDGKTVKFEFCHISLPKLENDLIRKLRTIKEIDKKYQILKRIVTEYTVEDINVVLELIEDGLYRGEQFKGLLEYIKSLIEESRNADNLENWIWFKLYEFNLDYNPFNTAIGNLVERIKDGWEIDKAIEEYLRIVSPENYQQLKNREIGKALVENAKKTLIKEGLIDSIDMKIAQFNEIPKNELIYYDSKVLSDELSIKFNDILKAIEEIEIESDIVRVKDLEKQAIEIDFDEIENVLRDAKRVELLVTPSIEHNIVVLTKTKKDNVTPIFKWGNNWSWTYIGGYSDSIIVKEKVKKFGGNVEGILRVSLYWESLCDFDLHCIDCYGSEIYFSSKEGKSGGKLDIDMNVSDPVRGAIENIYWENEPSKGNYRVFVHNYRQREKNNGFIVEIEYKGKIVQFKYPYQLDNNERVDVCEFKIGDGEIDFVWINPKIEILKGEIDEKGKWVEVKAVLPTPNYWSNSLKVGQKHIVLMLKNVTPIEAEVRPFNIDQIDNKYRNLRKFFALLIDKIKVKLDERNVFGIGISQGRGKRLFLRIVDKKGSQKLYKIVS